MKPIEFQIPIKLVSSGNAREHWRKVAKRKKEQRSFGRMFCEDKLRMTPASETWRIAQGIVLKVTITRIGKRVMDDDNLAASAKYVRDGIADALGIDDGDTTKVTWAYKQLIGKEYGCHIRIEGA